MKQVKVFQAEDGTEFATEADCKLHEMSLLLEWVGKASMDQVSSAIDNPTSPLAAAIERVGNMIGEARRKNGDLKRRKKAAPE